MRYDNIIELELSGRYALFTDPLTKAGGEKCSYPIPTYEALKGILSSVYWLPEIAWIIDAVRIMNPIRTESMTVPVRHYFRKGRDMSIYTYLRDVRYRVRAHFIPRDLLSFSVADEHRHYHSALRMLRHGGRRPPFLGTADCTCAVTQQQFGSDAGHYDNISTDMGMMFHGFSYHDGEDCPYEARYFRCRMVNGVIHFPQPQDCTLIQSLSQDKHHALV